MTDSSTAPNPKVVLSKARIFGMKSALFGARALSWGANRLRSAVTRSVHPLEAAELTRWDYNFAESYRRGQTQTLGLHTFEQAAVDRFFPPAPAKVLVLGCGGGREIVALQRLGYDCVGSEPARTLLAAAATACSAGTVLRLGGIEDAQQHLPDAPFAAVVVGWGAWGYVLHPVDRIEALRKLAALCPKGPVLLSWQFFRRQSPQPGGRQDGVPKTWTASIQTSWRDQVRVSPGRGIAAELNAEQVASEAELAGLSLIWDGTGAGQYPHMVVAGR